MSDNQEEIDRKCKELVDSLTSWVSTQKCAVCGRPATGFGGENTYCHEHFWAAFEKMEEGLTDDGWPI